MATKKASQESPDFTPKPGGPVPGPIPFPRPEPGPFPLPEPLPMPLPPDWWKCFRRGPVSGRYESGRVGIKTGNSLELRVDIDPRYSNSPVMDRVSGDIWQSFNFGLPGRPHLSWRVYRESWILDSPKVNWSRCSVEITGTVRWWKGIHPETEIRIIIPWSTFSVAGPAEVTFSYADGTSQRYSCTRRSDSFRTLNLEVDVVQSVSEGRILPGYDTHAHDNRPTGLPQRVLTVEESYKEAGIDLTIRTDRTIIDDSAAEFTTWSPAELHDAMETHFSQIGGGWPKWEMWGLLAGQFDNSGVGGIMFDAAAAYGGAGEPPERQGFAVFRNHQWYNNLPAGEPSTQQEAEAMRKYLYTWVHEAGHAFNFLHSWDKNRPDSLSWMNYDWRYDNRNGTDSFWSDFLMRFDDEELIHLRHGDRASVIMGGDPWASGGHIETPPGAGHHEAPPGALSQMEGNSPLELIARSKGYFEFMEPVEIELRLRNLLPDIPITVDTQLDPAFGGVIVYLQRPDGRIMEYEPVMCKLATPQLRELRPGDGRTPGADRYSEKIFLSYGRFGFYFDAPGDYLVRVLYQGAGDLLITSNIHRIRVGHPTSKEEDRLAQDFFTYPVGMSLYLNGSQSPFLQQGMDTLQEISSRFNDQLIGAKAANVIANSIAEPFFRIDQKDKKRILRKTHKADPEEALKITEPLLSMFKKAEGLEARQLNLSYHQLVVNRSNFLSKMDKTKEAKGELATLREHLEKRGVNKSVLDDIQTFEKSL